jgi:hypothetical protein
MSEHELYADAAERALIMARFNAKRINHVVRVIFNGETYYVKKLPATMYYGAELTWANEKIVKKGDINLCFDHIRRFTLKLSTDEIYLYNRSYRLCSGLNYDGHLFNNMYTSYKNKWIVSDAYDNLINRESYKIESFDDYSILDSNFMPAVAEPIDILNIGFKFVVNNGVLIVSNNLFSLINHKHVDGKFVKSERDDLFRFVDENGKLFALLINPRNSEQTLASSDKVLEFTDIGHFSVKPKNGLYNDFQVKYDVEKFGVRTIYYYRDMFFIINYASIVELDARKPDSGLKTKAAVASVE